MPKKLSGVLLAVVASAVTLGAIFLPGSQPGQGRTLEDPGNCGCHRGYDDLVEPMFTWRSSMMSQAARDPIFFSALDLANHDLADAGTFCLRCHSPIAHLEGRTEPPDGSALTGTDLEGVFCDFCHAQVDPLSAEGQALVEPDVTSYGNAMWVITDTQEKLGPYTDPEARHEWLYSPFHRSSEACASCHDVSNPLLCDPADPYNVQKCLPEQRTYSEWANSWYATQGEAGNCQSCHMPHVADGKACKQGSIRTFVPTHRLAGGNTWVPDAIAVLFAGDNSIDFDALAQGKLNAIDMLQDAATLEAFDVTDQGTGRVDVRVTNHTGHKLPTGYPEGRRMWINVIGYNSLAQPIFESGAYDAGTAILDVDSQAKVYEIHFGVEQPDGSCDFSFRLVQNNCIEKDNRIPPKGFTNAAFEAVGAGHTHYHYPDGQFWDDTPYELPAEVVSVDVNLYYQTTTKEYIEFLASAIGSGQRGADLLATFNATGKAVPVLMASTSVVLDADGDGMGDAWELAHGLDPGAPGDGAGDLDGDGLSNYEEYVNNSHPDNPDTDGDGLNDGPEVNTHLTDPADPDTDADGLTDGDEVNVHLTNPLLPDTDGGGEGDGSEVAGGRNPLVPGDDGEIAAYSALLTTPECVLGKSPCIVPESLINGRDHIHDGAEPNAPNTLYASSCADGNTGSYHHDESMDSFILTDLIGSEFQAGDLARLDAQVFCWTDVGFDQLHVFHADSVTTPIWTYAGTTTCDAIGEQTLSLTFNLANSAGRHAIRAAFTYESAPAACDAGDWNDRDDVVISVAPNLGGDVDGDGLSDDWENSHACMMANTVDDGGDYDGDALLNGAENGASTDPCAWDSDGDLLPDGFEVASGATLNPNNPGDGALDPDTDTNSTAHEYWNGTDPWDPDPVPNPFQNPGCYYWGDGDGDGIIGPGDIITIQLEIAGTAQSYDNVIPSVFDTLDIDKDNIPGPNDKTLLDVMFTDGSRASGYPGSPANLAVLEQPGATVAVGSTTHVTLSLENASGVVAHSGGFAVVFSVESGSATLLGGEGVDPFGAPANRYDVSGASLDSAKANIVIRVDGPGPISIGAKVPACGVEPNGRWCDEVLLAPSINVVGE